MTQGPTNTFLAKVAAEDPAAEAEFIKTLPPPAAELLPGVEFYLSAFHDLMHDRPPAMGGVSFIPWAAIDRYAERHGIDGDEFAVFFKLVRVCDAEFVAVMSAKRPRPMEVAG